MDDNKPQKAHQGHVRTPTLIQIEAVECGAAALGIVLGYYGLYVPLEELRYACGVSRNGSDAYNLLQAARHYGLECEGFRAPPEELITLPGPFIIFWKNSHFLVYEGISKDTVYLNDPATGRRRVHYEEFIKSYSLVLLAMKPGKAFQKGGVKPSIWKGLRRRFRKISWNSMGYLIGLQALISVVAIFTPVYYRVFIDNILQQQLFGWIWFFIGIVITTGLVSGALAYLQNITLNKLARALSLAFSAEFFWHILQLPLSFFTQRYGGEVMSRLQLNQKVIQILVEQISVILISSLFMIGYFFLLLQYSRDLTLIVLCTGILNFIVWSIIVRWRTEAYATLVQESAKRTSTNIDALQNMESFHAMSAESFLFSKVIDTRVRTLNAQQELGNKDIGLNVFTSAIQSTSSLVILGAGAWKMMHGELSVGMFVAFQMLSGYFLQPINQLVGFFSGLQSFKIDLQRLDDVLDNLVDPLFSATHSIFDIDIEPHLEINNITFGYSPYDDPLVKEVSINIKPKTHVAIVGKSGSGKSTIAKLAAGLYAPWSGTIQYGGKNISDFSQTLLSNTVGWVDQSIFLFKGSLKDNIRLWNDGLSDEKLQQAVYDAGLKSFLENVEGGLNYVLDEGGGNISKGEQQRVQVARALVKNPKMLILDEATNGLDIDTEAFIINQIKKREITALYLTHRISLCKQCDYIYVLQRGLLVEEGTHEELMSRGGIYVKLMTSEETYE